MNISSWLLVLLGVSHLAAALRADEPQMAVYTTVIAPDQTDAYARWIGRPLIWAEDFTAPESWDNIENPGWLLKPWGEWVNAKAGRRFILGVPILPGAWDGSGPTMGDIDRKSAVSLRQGGRGDYNKHFAILAKSLVAAGLEHSILRLGWEFNGGWYTWRASVDPQAFVEYWRQIVTTMRAVKGAEHLEFCWNPTVGELQLPAERAWPGDAFVDYIGLDVYDQSWLKDTYPFPKDATPAEVLARQKRAWNDGVLNATDGLLFWDKFAHEHDKPLAFPEWGVVREQDGHGGLDNPFFIEQMHAFITAPEHRVAFYCYFDIQAPDGEHKLSPGVDGKFVTPFPNRPKCSRGCLGGSFRFSIISKDPIHAEG